MEYISFLVVFVVGFWFGHFFTKNWGTTFGFVKQYLNVSKKTDGELEAEKEAAVIGEVKKEVNEDVEKEKVVSVGVGQD